MEAHWNSSMSTLTDGSDNSLGAWVSNLILEGLPYKISTNSCPFSPQTLILRITLRKCSCQKKKNHSCEWHSITVVTKPMPVMLHSPSTLWLPHRTLEVLCAPAVKTWTYLVVGGNGELYCTQPLLKVKRIIKTQVATSMAMTMISTWTAR